MWMIAGCDQSSGQMPHFTIDNMAYDYAQDAENFFEAPIVIEIPFQTSLQTGTSLGELFVDSIAEQVIYVDRDICKLSALNYDGRLLWQLPCRQEGPQSTIRSIDHVAFVPATGSLLIYSENNRTITEIDRGGKYVDAFRSPVQFLDFEVLPDRTMLYYADELWNTEFTKEVDTHYRYFFVSPDGRVLGKSAPEKLPATTTGWLDYEELWTSENSVYFNLQFHDTVYKRTDYTLSADYVANLRHNSGTQHLFNDQSITEPVMQILQEEKSYVVQPILVGDLCYGIYTNDLNLPNCNLAVVANGGDQYINTENLILGDKVVPAPQKFTNGYFISSIFSSEYDALQRVDLNKEQSRSAPTDDKQGIVLIAMKAQRR